MPAIKKILPLTNKNVFVFRMHILLMEKVSGNLSEVELRRKLLHITGGTVFAFAANLLLHSYSAPAVASALALCIAFGLVVSLSYRKNLITSSSAFPLSLLYKVIEKFEREEEKKKIPGKGVFMFLLGAILTIIIFKTISIVTASLLIVSLGDGASTLIGLKFGKHILPYNKKKTLEGSLAFVIFGFAGALTQVSPAQALAGAAISMVVESLPLRIDDNLAIPIVAAAVMSV
jgi:dolichol kinase